MRRRKIGEEVGEREETGGGRTSYSRGKEKREVGEKGGKKKKERGKR